MALLDHNEFRMIWQYCYHHFHFHCYCHCYHHWHCFHCNRCYHYRFMCSDLRLDGNYLLLPSFDAGLVTGLYQECSPRHSTCIMLCLLRNHPVNIPPKPASQKTPVRILTTYVPGFTTSSISNNDRSDSKLNNYSTNLDSQSHVMTWTASYIVYQDPVFHNLHAIYLVQIVSGIADINHWSLHNFPGA